MKWKKWGKSSTPKETEKQSPQKEPDGQKKKRRLKISELFYNNHFVMAFSLVCALILWFVMAMTNTTERPWEVSGVAVDVVLSDAAQQANLKVFEQSDTTATVSVTGNGVIVNRLQSSDLTVEATLTLSAEEIPNGLTEYTLPLEPRKAAGSELTDYQLVDVNPQEVTVLVDQYEEKTFTIESNLQYGRDNQYFYNEPSLSSESVTISGPKSSVDKVSRVVAEYETSDVLTSTRAFTCTLVAYDENGNQVEDQYLEYSIQEVDATVSVLPREECDLSPNGINMPESFPVSRMSVDPASIVIAGPEDALQNLDAIALEPVDFSEVDLDHTTFTRSISLPAGFKNINNAWEADVTVNLEGYSQKSLTINNQNVVVQNAAAGQSVDVLTENLEIQVVGPQSQVEALTAANVYARLDMSGQANLTGAAELPVTISFTNASGCWAYGKYTVSVQVEKQ
mgnify:FL=1